MNIYSDYLWKKVRYIGIYCLGFIMMPEDQMDPNLDPVFLSNLVCTMHSLQKIYICFNTCYFFSYLSRLCEITNCQSLTFHLLLFLSSILNYFQHKNILCNTVILLCKKTRDNQV